jgi:hypothetical protein
MITRFRASKKEQRWTTTESSPAVPRAPHSCSRVVVSPFACCHSWAIARPRVLQCMILAEGHRQDCLDLLRGGASHSDLGRGLYATHAPLASVILRSCSIRNPAFPADHFSDTILAPAGHEFIRQKQHQAAWQSELHEQRHLCEQQRADSSATRELLRATTRSHRAMSRWKLQLQPEPKRNVFTSWWGREMALVYLGRDRSRNAPRR